jgi:hypothetical protein
MKQPRSFVSKVLVLVGVLLVLMALVVTGFAHLWNAGAAPIGADLRKRGGKQARHRPDVRK